MSDMIISTIKSINLEKGEIIINRSNPNQKYDYLCTKSYYEKSLSKKELDTLKVGAKLSFKPIEKNKGFYAQDLKIIVEEILVGKSTIKRIDRVNGHIIIHKLNEEQENDFLCNKAFYEKSLTKEELDNLSEGDEVEFNYTIDNKKYFARNIKLLTKDQTKNTESPFVAKNTLELTNQFIENLKFNLKNITNSEDFEDFIFFILKSLGISEIYAIPRNNAGGRPDGVFKVSNISTNTPKLEVIYDCTLCRNWEDNKKQQVINYKDQICKNNMSIEYVFIEQHTKKPIKTSILFNNNSEKQIWIITKNNTRKIETIPVEISGEEIQLLVKEVNVIDLISILESKLLDTKYIKIDDIADKLKHI